eukprot:3085786-Amphidinium_carterae.1
MEQAVQDHNKVVNNLGAQPSSGSARRRLTDQLAAKKREAEEEEKSLQEQLDARVARSRSLRHRKSAW